MKNSIYQKHAGYLKQIKSLLEQIEQQDVHSSRLPMLQKKLDVLFQLYQADESIGEDRYLLYQGQAVLCYLHYEDELAIQWMREAIDVKGSDYPFANDFLAHMDKPAESKYKINRLNRKSYILSNLLIIPAALVAYTLDVILYWATGTGLESNKYGMPFLSLSLAFVFIYSMLVGIKRLHDINRSGWEILIAMLPLMGLVIALPMLLKKGTVGNNRYGDAADGIIIYGITKPSISKNNNIIPNKIPWKYVVFVLLIMAISLIAIISVRNNAPDTTQDIYMYTS